VQESGILFQEQFKQIGVEMDIQQVSSDRFLSEVWLDTPFYMSYWNPRITEANLITTYLHSEGNWNAETSWNSPEMDEWIETANSTTDPEVRQENYGKVQQKMYEEGPYIIPLYSPQLAAKGSYVNNYPQKHTRATVFNAERIQLGDGAPTK
jgi:peptide/nickel transport system substrate-binding protein